MQQDTMQEQVIENVAKENIVKVKAHEVSIRNLSEVFPRRKVEEEEEMLSNSNYSIDKEVQDEWANRDTKRESRMPCAKTTALLPTTCPR